MSDAPPQPVGPTVADLQQQLLEQGLAMARWEVFAKHPQLRELGLLEQFQGGPDQIKQFGDKLAERFPPPAPTPAPITQQPTPAPAAAGQVNTPGAASMTTGAPQATETTATPTPSAADMLPQQSADAARAADVREKMTMGIATRQEVLWLSQYAPRREVDLGNGKVGYSGGFVSAIKGLKDQ